MPTRRLRSTTSTEGAPAGGSGKSIRRRYPSRVSRPFRPCKFRVTRPPGWLRRHCNLDGLFRRLEEGRHLFAELVLNLVDRPPGVDHPGMKLVGHRAVLAQHLALVRTKA